MSTAFLAEDADLRARSIWADILNAARHLGPLNVSANITIHLTREPEVFARFVAISGGTLGSYPGTGGRWQEDVTGEVGGVRFVVLFSRAATAEELARVQS